MELSVTEAAIEGLRVARRTPGTVAIWAGVYILGLFLAILLAFMLMGAPLFALAAKPANTPFDSALAEQMAGGFLIGAIIVVPVLALLSAVLTAAIYRSVLKPDDRGFAYLKFGADEFRVLGVSILFSLLCLVVVGGPGGVIAAACLGLWAKSKGLSFLIGALGGLAVLVLWTWLGVRLSLATVLTFAERRIQLFSSWGLTKGRFWPLLGMYLIITVINFGIGLVVSTLSNILQAMMGTSSAIATGAQSGSLESLGGAPVAIIGVAILVILNLIAAGLQLVITYAPQASVYKQLKGDEVSAAF